MPNNVYSSLRLIFLSENPRIIAKLVYGWKSWRISIATTNHRLTVSDY